MKLYLLQLKPGEDDYHISPACIFSESAIDVETEKKLRFAQEVIESQWLHVYNPTPTFIVKISGPIGIQLFDGVYLIDKKDWDKTIDLSDVMLVNEDMWNLCKNQEATFFDLSRFSSSDLVGLFADYMFVVAGVY